MHDPLSLVIRTSRYWAFATSLAALAACATPAPVTTTLADNDPVIAAVRARDDALAQAHGRGDMATYRAGLSDRYAYIDVGGQRVTADTLGARRNNDQRRVVSVEDSENEAIRLSEDVVLLRGYTRTHATYFGGLPRITPSRWTALWVREADGVWRLTAETATHVADEMPEAPVIATHPPGVAEARAGRWKLQLDPALTLVLEASEGRLIGHIDGHAERWTFSPASLTQYVAAERRFELRFSPDGQALEMITWGTPTRAVRE